MVVVRGGHEEVCYISRMLMRRRRRRRRGKSLNHGKVGKKAPAALDVLLLTTNILTPHFDV